MAPSPQTLPTAWPPTPRFDDFAIPAVADPQQIVFTLDHNVQDQSGTPPKPRLSLILSLFLTRTHTHGNVSGSRQPAQVPAHRGLCCRARHRFLPGRRRHRPPDHVRERLRSTGHLGGCQRFPLKHVRALPSPCPCSPVLNQARIPQVRRPGLPRHPGGPHRRRRHLGGRLHLVASPARGPR